VFQGSKQSYLDKLLYALEQHKRTVNYIHH